MKKYVTVHVERVLSHRRYNGWESGDKHKMFHVWSCLGAVDNVACHFTLLTYDDNLANEVSEGFVSLEHTCFERRDVKSGKVEYVLSRSPENVPGEAKHAVH